MSLIKTIPDKFIIQERRVIIEVSRVTQKKKQPDANVTRRGTLDPSVGFKRRNNQMLMSLNLLKKMKNSAIFYLLHRSVGNKDR